MPAVNAVNCSSERARSGTTSSKNSMVTRTISTDWRSAIRLRRSCGTTSKACAVYPTSPFGLRIHSTKLTTAVCTTSWTLDRCEASSSAKNGSRSSRACTAWVASRPEYWLNLRNTDSGTVSSTSRVEAGGTNRLSGIPKSYAIFLAELSKDAATLGDTRVGGLLRRCEHVVDLVLVGRVDGDRLVD